MLALIERKHVPGGYGDMRVALLLGVLVVASCTNSMPAISTSPGPGGIGGIVPTTWVFAGTLALPADPNVYSDLIVQAKPLADGGWIVVRAASPRPRSLCDPTWFGCGLVRAPLGTLERWDASGRVVAREHGAEPFGLRQVSVFESHGVVIGGGPWVRNGDLHAFRLDTLDGITTSVGDCVAIAGSCYGYRVDYQAGQATLDLRDPTDLHVTRPLSTLLAPSVGPPAIFPSANLVAWRSPSGAPPFVHAAALDATRPVAISWLARLQSACDLSRVADDRAFVMFGPPTCSGDTGWHAELIEVSSGRIVRAFPPSQSISGNARDQIVLYDTGVVVDPRDGRDGPTLAGGDPISLDWDRGMAVAPLSDGGAAVYKRVAVTGAPRDLPFTTIANATCPEYEYPRVMNAHASTVKCAALASAVGPGRILLATGRFAYGPAAFTVTQVTTDSATHIIDIRYVGSGRRTNISDPSPTAVIELHDAPAGEWLVRFMGEGGDLYTARAFVIHL